MDRVLLSIVPLVGWFMLAVPPATAAPVSPDVAFGHSAALSLGQAAVVVSPVINLRQSPGWTGKPIGDVIDLLPIGTQVHVIAGPVVSGDGLGWYQVALPYGTTGWAAEYSSRGERLLAPAGGVQLAASTLVFPMPSLPAAPSAIVEVVRPADTLGKLANRLGTSVRQLMVDNGLWNSVIDVGQSLYVRQPGDERLRIVGRISWIDWNTGIVQLDVGSDGLWAIAVLPTATIEFATRALGSRADLQLGQTIEVFGVRYSQGYFGASSVFVVDGAPGEVTWY